MFLFSVSQKNIKKSEVSFCHFRKYKFYERDYTDVLQSDLFLFSCCPAPRPNRYLDILCGSKSGVEDKDGWVGDKLSKTAKEFQAAPSALFLFPGKGSEVTSLGLTDSRGLNNLSDCVSEPVPER